MLFKNKFFWISFFIFLVIFSYVFGVSWLWIWTMKQNLKVADYYIKKYIVDNTPIYTALYNIKLADNKFVEDSLLRNSVLVIKDARYYIKSNIIDLLTESDNKTTVLETYLSMMSYTLNRINFYKNQFYSKITYYEDQYSKCSAWKIQGDNLFFDGLYSYDGNKLVEGLKQSVNNWSCAEKNRIYLSAYTKIYKYLDYVGNLLQIKYDLLSSNADLILKNIDLFRNQNLQYLINLRDKLDSFTDYK